MEVYCRTNLDNYEHEEWPTQFLTSPTVGDFVMSHRGKRLRIVSITHCTYGDSKFHSDKRIPLLEIELGI